jgi:hypothetical protein
MIEKLSKRVKKTIVNNVEKLIRKYGEAEVKCVINSVFNEKRERKKLEETVKKQELELEKLKSKLR